MISASRTTGARFRTETPLKQDGLKATGELSFKPIWKGNEIYKESDIPRSRSPYCNCSVEIKETDERSTDSTFSRDVHLGEAFLLS